MLNGHLLPPVEILPSFKNLHPTRPFFSSEAEDKWLPSIYSLKHPTLLPPSSPAKEYCSKLQTLPTIPEVKGSIHKRNIGGCGGLSRPLQYPGPKCLICGSIWTKQCFLTVTVSVSVSKYYMIIIGRVENSKNLN